MPRLFSSLLLLLLIASSASAVTMAWTPIGSLGNSCDLQSQGCFGTVGYSYSIGTYEVTNAQYAEFLNAKASVDDPHDLYFSRMGHPESPFNGGITRSGDSGSYTYSAIDGRGDMPVNFVSFYAALRFANWMNNGQGIGDTESGAYTLLGGGVVPTNGQAVPRNLGATIVLSSEDEWYKAAYYDPRTVSYFDNPIGTNAPPSCTAPTAAPNSANCGAVGDLTPRGSYSSSPSPYGTFDQAGNVNEWNEAIAGTTSRVFRGGAYISGSSDAATRLSTTNTSRFRDIGFRLAMIPGGYIPEPGTGLLLLAGLLGLAGWRRLRA